LANLRFGSQEYPGGGLRFGDQEYTPLGTTLSITNITPDPVLSNSTVTITGTDFESSQGTGDVELSSGSILSSQTINSWSDTSIGLSVVKGNIPYTDSNQSVSYTVTNNSADSDTYSITFNPPSGFQVVTAVSPVLDSTSIFGLVTGGTAVSNDQLLVPNQSRNSNSVTYNTDGTFSISGGSGTDYLDNVEYWDSTNGLWSGPVTVTLYDPTLIATTEGTVTFTGLSVDIIGGEIVEPLEGSVAISGLEPNLIAPRTIDISSGGVIVTGTEPTLVYTRVISPESGSVRLRGSYFRLGGSSQDEQIATVRDKVVELITDLIRNLIR
jgi:hypothetical protein